MFNKPGTFQQSRCFRHPRSQKNWVLRRLSDSMGFCGILLGVCEFTWASPPEFF